MRQKRLARLALLVVLAAVGMASCSVVNQLRMELQQARLSQPVADSLADGTPAIQYIVMLRRPAVGAGPSRAGVADVDTAAPAAGLPPALVAPDTYPPRKGGNRPARELHTVPADSLAWHAAERGARIRHLYRAALYGFAAALSDRMVDELRRHPRVVAVTPVIRGTTAAGVQPLPPWGLDRIDQPESKLDSQYVFSHTGAGVDVYVVDSGIRFSHADFAGRARPFYDVFGGAGADSAGHGTHVAATIGGKVYGVAKGARLFSVRVVRTTTYTTANLIKGLDEVILRRDPIRRAVINLSLTGPQHLPLDTAVARTVASGITVVAAAGNYTIVTTTGKKYGDACNYSPARAAEGITVAGSRRADALYSLTDVGSCVDVFAPAVGILSAGIGSDADWQLRDGTSMAAAHVTGAVALYLEASPAATPAQVAKHLLVCTALQGKLTGVPTGTVNRLVFTGTPATVAAGCP